MDDCQLACQQFRFLIRKTASSCHVGPQRVDGAILICDAFSHTVLAFMTTLVGIAVSMTGALCGKILHELIAGIIEYGAGPVNNLPF